MYYKDIRLLMTYLDEEEAASDYSQDRRHRWVDQDDDEHRQWDRIVVSEVEVPVLRLGHKTVGLVRNVKEGDHAGEEGAAYEVLKEVVRSRQEHGGEGLKEAYAAISQLAEELHVGCLPGDRHEHCWDDDEEEILEEVAPISFRRSLEAEVLWDEFD
jgi:hypothetical protein